MAASINHIADVVKMRYRMVTPKYNKLWRGRELAIARMFGSWEGSYSLLDPILQAIQRTNPGTKYTMLTKDIGVDGARQFKAVAWAFGPCIAECYWVKYLSNCSWVCCSGRGCIKCSRSTFSFMWYCDTISADVPVFLFFFATYSGIPNNRSTKAP